MIKFFQERVEPFYNDARPLLDAYWNEADERREEISMSLNLPVYKVLEKQGLLRIYTTRDDDKLIGFVIFVVSPCDHTGELKAVTEISYIDPVYRGQSILPDMFSKIEEDLKEGGVGRIFWTLKTEFPHNSLMDKLGLTHVENVYMKEVV